MKFCSPSKPLGSSLRGSVVSRFIRAFSLIEMLVVVALLSIIILGLVAMFDQVRRAFTASTTQVDVLEGGRMAMDLITREVEEMAPYHVVGITNFYVNEYPSPPYPKTSALLSLVAPDDQRTNFLENLYFLSAYNHQWTGVGFWVDSPEMSNGIPIGSLYTTNLTLTASNIPVIYGLGVYTNSSPGTFHRLVDGVVHFRVLAYDMNGKLLTINGSNNANTNNSFSIRDNVDYPDMYFYCMDGHAVPAYVDVELGVLESRTLAKLRGVTNNAIAANNFLSNHAAQVHLFRQRIPIRNADPQAYK
jgi:prepilin-type N-terminal cleavage/methylation domain-containing protein